MTGKLATLNMPPDLINTRPEAASRICLSSLFLRLPLVHFLVISGQFWQISRIIKSPLLLNKTGYISAIHRKDMPLRITRSPIERRGGDSGMTDAHNVVPNIKLEHISKVPISVTGPFAVR